MALLAGSTLLAVDTETTGMSVDEGHRLVEVARVAIVDGQLAENWSSLVNPGRPIPPDATPRARDLRRDGGRRAARPRRSAARCARRAPTCRSSSTTRPFDLPFLIALFEEAGAPPLRNPIVDTLGLARGLFGHGRATRSARWRSGCSCRPRSRRTARLGDARTTARLLRSQLAARWEAERGVRSLAELAAAQPGRDAPDRRAPLRRAALPARRRAADNRRPSGRPLRAPRRRAATERSMQTMTIPDVGQAAPDFRLRGRGRHALLALRVPSATRTCCVVFYPLAFSPVCSHQLPELQAMLPRFEAAGHRRARRERGQPLGERRVRPLARACASRCSRTGSARRARPTAC